MGLFRRAKVKQRPADEIFPHVHDERHVGAVNYTMNDGNDAAANGRGGTASNDATTSGGKVLKSSLRPSRVGKRRRRRVTDEEYEDDSIGESLDTEDQFELEIPMKKPPQSILRRPSSNDDSGRLGQQECFNPSRPKATTTGTANTATTATMTTTTATTMTKSFPLLAESSTVSSITFMVISDQSTAKSKISAATRSILSKNLSVSAIPGLCCGTSSNATKDTEDLTATNSILAGRKAAAVANRALEEDKKNKSRVNGNSGSRWGWLGLCGPREAAEMYVIERVSKWLRIRPDPLRRENSLFDTLDDEEELDGDDANDAIRYNHTNNSNLDGDVEGKSTTNHGRDAETTVAVVDDVSKMDQTVATNSSKWNIYHKVRSIPKLRSFRLRRKDNNGNSNSNTTKSTPKTSANNKKNNSTKNNSNNGSNNKNKAGTTANNTATNKSTKSRTTNPNTTTTTTVITNKTKSKRMRTEIHYIMK